VVYAWENSSKGIVIPTTNGKRGHPVLIDTRYFGEVEKLNPEKGLRELSVKYKNDVLLTVCNHAEILRDIDTPEDYEYEINKLQAIWKK
jgi:CTP:molybdopterin cytidylyltransferase MocA